MLREYALLADGERGIVVGPHGDFVWMCFPRWHDPALFSALIGGDGSYAVTPTETHVWGGYYEPRSLIWRSRWVTHTATIECREALALPSRPDRAVVLRRIVACTGTARVRCTLRTMADFGSMAPRSVHRVGDTWVVEHEHTQLRWVGAEAAHLRSGANGALEVELTLREGEHHDLVMVVEHRGADDELPNPEPGLGGDRVRLEGPDPGAGIVDGTAGCPTRVRGDARPHQRRWGHGRGRHDIPSGTRPPGHQLRLPFRVDPRSMLCGPRCSPSGGGRAR